MEAFYSSLGEYISDNDRSHLSFCRAVDEVPGLLRSLPPVASL
jgi:hypothetical protein